MSALARRSHSHVYVQSSFRSWDSLSGFLNEPGRLTSTNAITAWRIVAVKVGHTAPRAASWELVGGVAGSARDSALPLDGGFPNVLVGPVDAEITSNPRRVIGAAALDWTGADRIGLSVSLASTSACRFRICRFVSAPVFPLILLHFPAWSDGIADTMNVGNSSRVRKKCCSGSGIPARLAEVHSRRSLSPSYKG